VFDFGERPEVCCRFAGDYGLRSRHLFSRDVLRESCMVQPQFFGSFAGGKAIHLQPIVCDRSRCCQADCFRLLLQKQSTGTAESPYAAAGSRAAKWSNRHVEL